MKRQGLIFLLALCVRMLATAQNVGSAKPDASDPQIPHATAVANTANSQNIDLQAMLNALPHSTNRMHPGGGVINFGTGIFYTSAKNYYSNSAGVDTVKLHGNGGVSTCIVFTNAGEGLLLTGSNNNIGFISEGILWAATVDSTNALIHIKNGNTVLITDTIFHYWPAATNNDGYGLERGPSAESGPTASNLGGLWIDYSSGDQISIYDATFDNLQFGIYGIWDHLNLYHVFFGLVGAQYDDKGVVPRNTVWPKMDLRSIGGSITAVGGFQDNLFLSTHFFGCAWPFVNGISGRPHQQFNTVFVGGQLESYQGCLMLSVPDAGGRVVFRDMDYFGRATPFFGIITNNGARWVMNPGTASNVFEFSTYNGRDYVMKVAGHENLRLKNDGTVIGNLSPATNAPDTKPNAGQNTNGFDFTSTAIAAPTLGVKYTNTFGQRIHGSFVLVCSSVAAGKAWGALDYYNAQHNVTNAVTTIGIGGVEMSERLPVTLPAMSPGDWWMVTDKTSGGATISLTNVWYWKD